MNTLDVALNWYDLGVTPIPLRSMSKKPLVKWKKLQRIIPARTVIKLWFEKPDRNLAVLCGGPTHLAVLDFETMANWANWKVDHPSLAQTYSVRTARGMHVYLSPDKAIDTHMHLIESLDVKASGYVLTAPSVHPSGALYQVWSDRPILSVAAEDLLASLPMILVPPGKVGEVLPVDQPFSVKRLVQRVKMSYPILAVAQSMTDMQSSDGGKGEWYMGSCPWGNEYHLHGDKNASFWINTRLGRYGCYKQSCKGHRSGDVIDLYALSHHLTTRLAISELYNKLVDAWESEWQL